MVVTQATYGEMLLSTTWVWHCGGPFTLSALGRVASYVDKPTSIS